MDEADTGTAHTTRVEGEELGRAYLQLKQQYDNLVGRNLAGVFRTTLQGRFLECNQSMARILGFASPEELMRVHCDELYFNASDRERYVAELKEHRQLINHPGTLRHRSGRAIHVLENVFLGEQEGRPATIEGTLIDITSLRNNELEQRSLINNYRQLVERARDGILIVQDGIVRYANPVAEELTGRQVVGEDFSSLLHEEDRDKATDLLHALPANDTAGPMSARAIHVTEGPHEVILYATHTLHAGAPAAQVTLQDLASQQNLMQERTRLKIAEEVNQVLRQEIGEHRRTQEALKRSQQFARSLVNSSLDMIMAADADGIITEFNPAAVIKFGYEAEEAIGQDTRLLYAEVSEYHRVQEELNAHGVYAGEVVNIDSEGRSFTSFLAASKLRDEEGRVTGAMGVSRDITINKRDQEALRASEERYRDLFENASDLIQSIDQDGRFEYVNRAWRETLGYGEEDLRHLTIWDIVHPEERARFQQVFERAMQGELAGQVRTVFVGRTGREVHVTGNTNVRLVNDSPISTRSIFRDVTGVHEAQEQVQQHAAKLKALFESSEHMFWSVDKHAGLTSFNRGYADMFERLSGTRPELKTDLAGTAGAFAGVEQRRFWDDKYEEVFKGRPLRFETDLVDGHGRRVCAEIFLSPVFDPEGSVEEIFGVGHEITEQKEAEDLVREQAARLKAIFENSANMMIWTLDQEFKITSYNEHFRASTGRALGIEFSVGDSFIERMIPHVAGQRHERMVAKYGSALRGHPQQFEVEMTNHAGRPLWIENFLNPITVDGEVTEISCLAYGITDKKDAQKKLLESLHEKEVLLKEVHHRVKNNLQVISSILNLQSDHVDNDPRMIELLRDSQDRIRSMSFIHESLYQTKNFNSVDLGRYIEGLSRNLMMSYSLTGKVRLFTQVDRVELGLDQAIPCGLMLNELISNALKHAFPGGREGAIDIRVEHEHPRVRITISDDGIGLPGDFHDERSANLGLQLVHTLIGQLDGKIERSSKDGTRFAIEFDIAAPRMPA